MSIEDAENVQCKVQFLSMRFASHARSNNLLFSANRERKVQQLQTNMFMTEDNVRLLYVLWSSIFMSGLEEQNIWIELVYALQLYIFSRIITEHSRAFQALTSSSLKVTCFKVGLLFI